MPIYRGINKDFFRKWDFEMAYVLGFLYADGNLIKTQRDTWFWSIQITDLQILRDIKNVLNSSHKISKKKKVANCKQQYRLQIGSKTMCADLLELGMIPKKSNTIFFPKIPQIYLGDFVRGYFDGDGGVWIGQIHKKRKTLTNVINTHFTSGSIDFLLELKEVLKKQGLLGGTVGQKERGYSLRYSVRDSLKLYEIMYNREVLKLFLKRKKRKFEKYIRIRDRSSIG